MNAVSRARVIDHGRPESTLKNCLPAPCIKKRGATFSPIAASGLGAAALSSLLAGDRNAFAGERRLRRRGFAWHRLGGRSCPRPARAAARPPSGAGQECDLLVHGRRPQPARAFRL